MTEAGWLTSTDPQAMLLTMGVPVNGQQRFIASDRKLRLFACACCRFWKLDQQEQIDIWEKNGHPLYQEAARWAKNWADSGLRFLPSAAIRAALLRDIFGNPWQPAYRWTNRDYEWTTRLGERPSLPRRYLTWHDGIVVKLAQAAYDERERVCETCKGNGKLFYCGEGQCGRCHGTGIISDGTLDAGRLAVLCDALEEAGCTEEAMLRHLRGQAPCYYCFDNPAIDRKNNEWCT